MADDKKPVNPTEEKEGKKPQAKKKIDSVGAKPTTAKSATKKSAKEVEGSSKSATKKSATVKSVEDTAETVTANSAEEVAAKNAKSVEDTAETVTSNSAEEVGAKSAKSAEDTAETVTANSAEEVGAKNAKSAEEVGAKNAKSAEDTAETVTANSAEEVGAKNAKSAEEVGAKSAKSAEDAAETVTANSAEEVATVEENTTANSAKYSHDNVAADVISKQLLRESERAMRKEKREHKDDETSDARSFASENSHEQSGNQEELALDDARRVKVLSPGRLVLKRFMRNRLAIIGTCVLIFMFLFAFLGPVFSPYGESEVFTTFDRINTSYSQAVRVNSYELATFDGVNLEVTTPTNINKVAAQISDSNPRPSFVEGNNTYYVEDAGHGIIYVERSSYLQIARVTVIGAPIYNFGSDYAQYDTDEFKAVAGANLQDKATFTFGGREFKAQRQDRTTMLLFMLSDMTPAAYGSMHTFNNYDDVENAATNAVKVGALAAIADGRTSFTAGETSYLITTNDDGYTITDNAQKPLYEMLGYRIFSSTGEDTLILSYKRAMAEALVHMENEGLISYTFETITEIYNAETDQSTMENVEVSVTRNNDYFNGTVELTKLVYDINGAPSAAHWLGTDGNGMDNLTRMMYGGRISLMVGFIVIIIEVIIGVIMGGLAGYFGKWVDMLIMRIVDIFNCIPFLPIMVILGVVFESMMLSPLTRIIYMMMVMGFTSWTGITRLVRGQILMLREQEFMQAAEATGLSVPRRIFKHLVPNVMPQLIVSATMGLGDVIIMESTLSFLGLGTKYPMASWGSIINGVNTEVGLKTYTYVWIPVGLLISLTVIAFNFVGDGLRDAFDPKMKR